MKLHKDQQKIFDIGKYDGLNLFRRRHEDIYKYRIYNKGYMAGIKEVQLTNLLKGNTKSDTRTSFNFPNQTFISKRISIGGHSFNQQNLKWYDANEYK